jgi:hypothetical protein
MQAVLSARRQYQWRGRQRLQPGTAATSARDSLRTRPYTLGARPARSRASSGTSLPDDGFLFTGMSYDNTVALGASPWRHVAFIERPVALSTQDADAFSWLFSSDVSKHCARAGIPG